MTLKKILMLNNTRDRSHSITRLCPLSSVWRFNVTSYYSRYYLYTRPIVFLYLLSMDGTVPSSSSEGTVNATDVLFILNRSTFDSRDRTIWNSYMTTIISGPIRQTFLFYTRTVLDQFPCLSVFTIPVKSSYWSIFCGIKYTFSVELTL